MTTSSFDEVAELCRLCESEKCWFSFSSIHLELDQPPEKDDTELCGEGALIENTEEDDEEAQSKGCSGSSRRRLGA